MISLRIFTIAALFILSFSSREALAQASPSQPVADQSSFEVAGVKLGMSKEEAIAALKTFDSTAIIQDLTKTPEAIKNPSSILGADIWGSHFAILAVSHDLDAYNQLSIDNNKRRDECEKNYLKNTKGLSEKDNGNYRTIVKENEKQKQCVSDVDNSYKTKRQAVLDAPRAIAVWFSPVPGQEKVIAVSSSTSFVKSIPTVESVAAAITAKYGSASHSMNDLSGGKLSWWKFDARGRLKLDKEAAKTGFHQATKDVSIHIDCVDPSKNCTEIFLRRVFQRFPKCVNNSKRSPSNRHASCISAVYVCR